MVLYRRNAVLGGTFFFTVVLRDRRACTLVEHVDLLRVAYAEVKTSIPNRRFGGDARSSPCNLDAPDGGW